MVEAAVAAGALVAGAVDLEAVERGLLFPDLRRQRRRAPQRDLQHCRRELVREAVARGRRLAVRHRSAGRVAARGPQQDSVREGFNRAAGHPSAAVPGRRFNREVGKGLRADDRVSELARRQGLVRGPELAVEPELRTALHGPADREPPTHCSRIVRLESVRRPPPVVQRRCPALEAEQVHGC